MQQWLAVNETAKALLERLQERRLPSITGIPPLHRVPLHGGHVFEVAGPSGSGKSELLLQVAVTCILPKNWEGLFLSGSEKPVVYLDLDCRFDILRLVHLLICRITEAQGIQRAGGLEACQHDVNKLIRTCLNRFYLKRCCNSYEFLVALKTARPHLKQIAAEHGTSAQLLMIDSIGAFYWLDRGTRTTSGEAGRRTLSLQTVSGAVVNELRQLAQTYSQLSIIATKTVIHKNLRKDLSSSRHQGQPESNYANTYGGFRVPPKESVVDDEFASRSRTSNSSERTERSSHREYMPATWRAFVSHRLLLQGPYQSGFPSTDRACNQSSPFFTAEWDKPFSTHVDHFLIQDDGIKLAN